MPENCRLDIEDLFMSGEADILARDASGSSDDGQRKRRMHDVDACLLNCQFVASKRHPDRRWREIKGSEVGMTQPGDISDSAFAYPVGTCFLKPEVLESY